MLDLGNAIIPVHNDPVIADPYLGITKDNFHEILYNLYIANYEPSQLTTGIPKGVDPYLYDYALSLYLPKSDYKRMQDSIGLTYIQKSEFDSRLQKLLKDPKATQLTEAALAAVDVTLAPVDKILFEILKAEPPSCPNSSTLAGCGLETLSSALYSLRPSYNEYLSKDLPLTAWLNEHQDLKKHLLNFPKYKAMRQRIWEEAIPANSPLRFAKGSPRAGQIKPDWVIQLQSSTKNSNRRSNKFTWFPET